MQHAEQLIWLLSREENRSESLAWHTFNYVKHNNKVKQRSLWNILYPIQKLSHLTVMTSHDLTWNNVAEPRIGNHKMWSQATIKPVHQHLSGIVSKENWE